MIALELRPHKTITCRFSISSSGRLRPFLNREILNVGPLRFRSRSIDHDQIQPKAERIIRQLIVLRVLKGRVQRLGCTRSGWFIGNTRLCQRIDKPIVSAFAIPVLFVVFLLRQHKPRQRPTDKSYVLDFTQALRNACPRHASKFPFCSPTGANQSLSNYGGAFSHRNDTVDTNISMRTSRLSYRHPDLKW